MFNNSFDSSIGFFFHVFFLLTGFVYTIFAVVIYLQIGTLEKWLASLKRYNLRKLAIVHLVMSVIGVLLIFTLFF